MKTAKKILLILCLINFLLLNNSCKKEPEHKEYLFTQDELSWIFWKTLNSGESTLEQKYQLKYLMNGKDTVIMKVTSSSGSSIDSDNNLTTSNGYVDARIDLPKYSIVCAISMHKNESGFYFDYFNIRNSDDNYFKLYKYGTTCFELKSIINNSTKDTAIVNKTKYDNTYKFYNEPQNNFYTKVYFRNSSGFIKFETYDNQLFELIKN